MEEKQVDTAFIGLVNYAVILDGIKEFQEKIDKNQQLNDNNCHIVIAACLLVVAMSALQRAGVFSKIRLQEYEFMIRENQSQIIVRDHKTEKKQPAIVCLDAKYKAWFELYAKYIRPQRYVSNRDDYSLGYFNLVH